MYVSIGLPEEFDFGWIGFEIRSPTLPRCLNNGINGLRMQQRTKVHFRGKVSDFRGTTQ